jgi:hypothetical protein
MGRGLRSCARASEYVPGEGFGCPGPMSPPPFSIAKPSSTVRPGPTSRELDPPPIGESESISFSWTAGIASLTTTLVVNLERAFFGPFLPLLPFTMMTLGSLKEMTRFSQGL